jgi:putative copper resistance protein D
MQLLIDVFGFLSVLLRGAEVAAQSFVVGGVIYLLCLVWPLRRRLPPARPELFELCAGWVRRAALALAAVVVIWLTVDGTVLAATADLSPVEISGASFFIAGLSTVGAAVTVWWLVGRLSGGRAEIAALLVLVAILLLACSMTSHAAARLDGRTPLIGADMLHQAGASVWIGGIPYFLLSLRLYKGEDRAAAAIITRFSAISMVAVSVLLLAGIGMALAYIDSIPAVYGTAYGVMVTTKVLLFALLLGLGFMNNRIGARLQAGDRAAPVLRLRRFAEAEIGIGLSVFFAAASLTSVPPAVDLVSERVTPAEIVERIAPRVPSLTSPDHQALAIPKLQAELDAQAARENKEAPRAFVPGAGVPVTMNAADILWSEYNHHWAGILVLLIGLLSLAEKSGHAGWARHWPLVFIGLAAFLFVRSDPEAWPLGETGFFESFRDPEILQHRIFILFISGFGIFEWMVRTGRMKSERAALVFPLVTAVAGALLLTHSHSLANVRQELLIELTHVPLAVLGIVAAWARWLELRLPAADGSWAGWLWRICFLLVGLVLLDYREA